MLFKRRPTKREAAKIFTGVKSRYLVITLRTVAILGIMGLLLGLAFWLFESPFFRIKTITCYQGKRDCPPAFLALLEPSKAENIFLFKGKTFALSVLKKSPQLREITIKKRLPNQLEVAILPRQAFAFLVTAEGRSAVVDETGFALEEATASVLPKIQVTDLPAVGEIVSDPVVLKSLELAKLLQVSYLNFEYIWYPDAMTLSIFFPDQLVATLSAHKELPPQVDSLQYILSHSRMEEKSLETVDLRFSKPIVTFSP